MKLPPSAKTPLLLQYLKLIVDPIRYVDSLESRYGDIFTLMFDGIPTVFVSNPEAIKQIFTNTKQITAPGELNRDSSFLTGERGLLQLDGFQHKHRRKLLMPAFHGARLQAYGQRICDVTAEKFAKMSLESESGKTVSMFEIIEAIALEISLGVVLGLNQNNEPRETSLRKLLPQIIKYLRSPFLSISFLLPFLEPILAKANPQGSFLTLRQELFQLISAEVAARRQQQPDNNHIKSSPTNILSELISIRDETGEFLSNDEIRDLLLSPLFAAQDASAIAITWALYWIHRFPSVREKLLQELDNLGESPNPMKIVELPYLSAVCNESLRIYPTQLFTFPRRVESPLNLLGYELNPDTVLRVNICATHRRQDLYPEPNQFKPKRFLERQFSPWEFLPFGGGSRGCIGGAFALYEMKLVLATILSRYQCTLAQQKPEQPRFDGLICYPANGVKMTILGQRQRQKSSQCYSLN
ncbi:MAG: cytochrome P450 [Oscillatoria sp. PMC 1051.18]|nr:cytochrome P450 [Oscillatoria sp. PMC 1050.18]MEC5031918.1 cytochrome P450 [Oscillatoria sp. PMC 1051.18]